MKKILSLILATCFLLLSLIPVLADDKCELTDGESLALYFINEFYPSDKGDGEEYLVTFDTENKHFIIHGHYPLLESLIIDRPEDYQAMAEQLEKLFTSVNNLVEDALEAPEEYYMTLSLGTANYSLEYPVCEYLCISTKGGTVHRVNDEFVSTNEIKFYVANENADASAVQSILDLFATKDVSVLGITCMASQNPDNNGFFIALSGAYCDKFAAGYKGKDADWVEIPDRYIIDCRELATKNNLKQISLTFLDEQGNAFGAMQFSDSYWRGYYYAIDD